MMICFELVPSPSSPLFFLLFSTLLFPPSKKKNKIGTTSLHSKQQNKRCRTTKAVLTSTLTTIYSPVQTCVFIYIIYIYIYYIYLSSLSLFFLSNFVICFLLIFSSSSTPLNRTPLTLVILIPSTKTMQSDVVTKYKIAADCVNGMFCFE